MITITPKALSGTIEVISSKSLSHRYVIAAGLAAGKSIIENTLDSDDLQATKNALTSLGVKFNKNRVKGTKIKQVSKVIDCKESGSTLRFFIPIAMIHDRQTTFIGKNRLGLRPLDVYQKAFEPFNYHFKYQTENYLPLDVKGPLKPGDYYIRADVSSQFLTGLLFSLPLLNGDSRIILTSELESKGYVDLTLDVLKKFGIVIDFKDNIYTIKGNQEYKPGKYHVESDYSQAAFFLVAGTLGKEIRLKGLNENSLQGDRVIIDIINQMGGSVYFKDGYLIAEPRKTKGITIDLAQYPDLGPVLMVLASLSTGSTHIINAKRLRIKESDRLDSMYQELTKLGVKIDMYEDSCIIYGVNQLKGNQELLTHKDHRIAMALAVASIACDNPITLDDEKVVSKSYPNFFEEFEKLKGEIKWIKD